MLIASSRDINISLPLNAENRKLTGTAGIMSDYPIIEFIAYHLKSFRKTIILYFVNHLKDIISSSFESKKTNSPSFIFLLLESIIH